MDAIKYLNERKKMTKNCKSVTHCIKCPLFIDNNGKGISCTSLRNNYPGRDVAIVEEWSKAHSAKTRLSEFLKIFPNAQVNEDGFPYLCIKNLKDGFDCTKLTCEDCKKEYWNEPIEEE